MIHVVDKKVIKHLVGSDSRLLEVPVRVHFEYSLESQRFVAGSMTRRYLFNRQAVLDNLPEVDAEQLDRDIEEAVDKSLIEHLKFNREAVGEIQLFESPDDPDDGEGEDPDSPQIIIP
jgi:hypothetical protein